MPAGVISYMVYVLVLTVSVEKFIILQYTMHETLEISSWSNQYLVFYILVCGSPLHKSVEQHPCNMSAAYARLIGPGTVHYVLSGLPSR